MSELPKRARPETTVYVLCALTVFVSVLHLRSLWRWHGWNYDPPPAAFAYVIQFLPIAAFFGAITAMVLNFKNRPKIAFALIYFSLIVALCVLALDGLSGTIGMVD